MILPIRSIICAKHLQMGRATRRAASAAVFIVMLLPFPQTGGVHLVSNQPTGTDNQNNAPVQYAPKMASKLGLPQPQHREPEALRDDSLATVIRQLMESHKRQTGDLERLAALIPRYTTEGPPPKRKTSKPTTSSKYPTRSSENSVIMRPAKQAPEKVLEPAKAESDLNSNRTEDKTQVAKNAPSSLRNQSALHHRNFAGAPHHIVYVPSYSYAPDHDPHNPNNPHVPHPHNSQVQVYYPPFAGSQTLNQNSQVPPNLHPKAVGSIQNPHSNDISVAPRCQDPATLQSTHSNVAGQAPHIQNPQTLHSYIVGTAPHIPNPQALFTDAIDTQPHMPNPQALFPNAFDTAPHIQNTQVLHSNAIDTAPHFQNPRARNSNVVSKAPQSSHPNVPQNPNANFVGLPTQILNPVILQGPYPSFVGKTHQSQDLRIPPGSHQNYVIGTSNHPFLPQGLHPHLTGETQQILYPTPAHGYPALKGQNPYPLHSDNTKPATTTQPVINDYNRPYIVMPYLPDVKAQHYQKVY